MTPERACYGDIRRHIRSGDLLAFGHDAWWPWDDFKTQMVRVWTRSEYSHVATALVMGGRVWVIEAVKPWPRIVPLSTVLPASWIPLAAPWRPSTEALAVKIIGTPRAEYSEWEAVKGGLGLLEPGADDRWMCAELAWVLARADGVDLGSDITPAGLVKAAENRFGINYKLHVEDRHD